MGPDEIDMPDDPRDPLHRALGYVVASMGSLEFTLTSELAGLVIRDLGPESLEERSGWLLRSEGVKRQLKRLRQLAKQRPDDDQRHGFLKTLDDIERLCDRRDELVHSAYLVEEAGEPTQRTKWKRKSEPVDGDLNVWETLTPDDIWKVGAAIERCQGDLMWHTPFLRGWGPDETKWPGNTSGKGK